MNNLGILADDVVRAAYIEECQRQNDWKNRVEAVEKSNREVRENERKRKVPKVR